MSIKLIYQTEVRGGRLHIFRRKEFLRDIQQFEGKRTEIILQLRKNRRSIEQNAYYWGVVVPMVRAGLYDAGWRYSITDTHQELKRMFLLREKVNENTGEVREYIASTTELTTTEMNDYWAEIWQWAAEYLNIQIPEPNEQTAISFDENG
jgi:hypothetical protein